MEDYQIKKVVYELNMTLNKARNNWILPSFRRPWFIFDETLSKNSADGVNKLLERLRNSKPGNIFKSAQISDHSDIRLSVRSNSAIWFSLLRLMIPLWPLKCQKNNAINKLFDILFRGCRSSENLGVHAVKQGLLKEQLLQKFYNWKNLRVHLHPSAPKGSTPL